MNVRDWFVRTTVKGLESEEMERLAGMPWAFVVGRLELLAKVLEVEERTQLKRVRPEVELSPSKVW